MRIHIKDLRETAIRICMEDTDPVGKNDWKCAKQCRKKQLNLRFISLNQILSKLLNISCICKLNLYGNKFP